jgi:hypothetical protein
MTAQLLDRANLKNNPSGKNLASPAIEANIEADSALTMARATSKPDAAGTVCFDFSHRRNKIFRHTPN